jgi:DNA-binding response OmpR family regulator
MMVRDAGGEPLTVFAGDEAVAAAKGIAVAIVDLSVPRLKGAALVAALKAIVGDVVVVSAARDAELVASEHNAHACFVKPFDVRALQRCLQGLLAP